MRKQILAAGLLTGLVLMAVLLGGCGKKGDEQTTTAVAAAQETSKAGKEDGTDGEKEEKGAEEAEKSDEKADAKEEQSDGFFPIIVRSKFDGQMEDYFYYIYGNMPKLYLLDEDEKHPALRKVLERYNKETEAKFEAFLSQNQKDALDVLHEDPDYIKNMGGFSYDGTVSITRIDEKVLSIRTNYESYMGGAHGDYEEICHNYDTASGRELALKDVVKDYNGLYNEICNYLDNCEYKDELWEDYKDTVKQMLEGTGEYGSLQWAFGIDGFNIHFDHYLLGPYVLGTVDVPLSDELLLEEYRADKKSWVLPVQEGGIIMADVNNDGKKEEVSYTVDRSEYEDGGAITVTCDGTSFSTEKVKEQNYYAAGGYSSEGYLIHTKSGKTWLYLENSSDNDFQYMTVFDLSDGIPRFVNAKGCSWYGSPIVTPDAFMIFTRFDVLGSYIAYQICHVEADGMPMSEDKEYKLDYSSQDTEEYRVTLTSTRELEVVMLDENGEPGAKEKLPSGTIFTILATDGESYVRTELDDGRQCRIYVEKQSDAWGWTVNGLDESECFEFVPYAG